jgi:flagellar hook-basal body complex protein FliE
MKVQLQPFDFAQAAARAGLRTDGQPLIQDATAAAQNVQSATAVAPASFQVSLSRALQSVSQTQAQAQHLQRELQLDNPAVGLEETMVAMQKAQLGFQSVVAVRNRFLQAYTDIMNMQV